MATTYHLTTYNDEINGICAGYLVTDYDQPGAKYIGASTHIYVTAVKVSPSSEVTVISTEIDVKDSARGSTEYTISVIGDSVTIPSGYSFGIRFELVDENGNSRFVYFLTEPFTSNKAVSGTITLNLYKSSGTITKVRFGGATFDSTVTVNLANVQIIDASTTVNLIDAYSVKVGRSLSLSTTVNVVDYYAVKRGRQLEIESVGRLTDTYSVLRGRSVAVSSLANLTDSYAYSVFRYRAVGISSAVNLSDMYLIKRGRSVGLESGVALVDEYSISHYVRRVVELSSSVNLVDLYSILRGRSVEFQSTTDLVDVFTVLRGRHVSFSSDTALTDSYYLTVFRKKEVYASTTANLVDAYSYQVFRHKEVGVDYTANLVDTYSYVVLVHREIDADMLVNLVDLVMVNAGRRMEFSSLIKLIDVYGGFGTPREIDIDFLIDLIDVWGDLQNFVLSRPFGCRYKFENRLELIYKKKYLSIVCETDIKDEYSIS